MAAGMDTCKQGQAAKGPKHGTATSLRARWLNCACVLGLLGALQ